MTPLLRKVILCSLLMSCWRWGAEEIFRPIAFAWLEWIRRLGPYVILEEHGPGIYHFLPAIGRHFCQRQASEASESFSGLCYFVQKKCNALNVSWQVVWQWPPNRS